jgi:hypothetical protein
LHLHLRGNWRKKMMRNKKSARKKMMDGRRIYRLGKKINQQQRLSL